MHKPVEARPDKQRELVDALTAAGFTVTITQKNSGSANEPPESSLTITGEDLSVVMDLIDLSALPRRRRRL